MDTESSVTTEQTLSDEAIIEIIDMHKWFGDFHVLQGINLTVHKQERIVICGPSGSGKSTLIRCINRLEEHQRGRIVVDGIDAYEEDNMQIVGNSDVELMQITPAERCVIITTDQQTGERPANNIMKVLGETRRKTEDKYASGLLFGNYMSIAKTGMLYIGDRLEFRPMDEDLSKVATAS